MTPDVEVIILKPTEIPFRYERGYSCGRNIPIKEPDKAQKRKQAFVVRIKLLLCESSDYNVDPEGQSEPTVLKKTLGHL